MLASKSLYNTNSIIKVTLTGVVTVSCILFNGCSPEAYAAGAVLFRYWQVQAQKEREEKIHLARQQKSVLVSRQPEIVRTVVAQAEDQKTIEEANQAYRNLEWHRSALLLKEAINRGKLSRSDLCKAYILLGAIAYQQGRVNEAESYFIKASEIDNRFTPSAELYPPSLIKFYRDIQKSKK
jgi:tetratricopeptide (TPR) repeat protein